jgi:hypothetical protein
LTLADDVKLDESSEQSNSSIVVVLWKEGDAPPKEWLNCNSDNACLCPARQNPSVLLTRLDNLIWMVVARPSDVFFLRDQNSSQINHRNQDLFFSETNLNFSIKNNLSFTRAIFIDQARIAPSA